MADYAEIFHEAGKIRWLPYLMYFHPSNHRSRVVNTDQLGFRVSYGADSQGSAGAGPVSGGDARLLVGSSAAFGIGATRDESTLPSRLWSCHADVGPWLNFGGWSYNSLQELLLFVLHRHLLPSVAEIVIFSGFNNLRLARLPASRQGDHGAFFNSGKFFDAITGLRTTGQHGSFSAFRRPRAISGTG